MTPGRATYEEGGVAKFSMYAVASDDRVQCIQDRAGDWTIKTRTIAWIDSHRSSFSINSSLPTHDAGSPTAAA